MSDNVQVKVYMRRSGAFADLAGVA